MQKTRERETTPFPVPTHPLSLGLKPPLPSPTQTLEHIHYEHTPQQRNTPEPDELDGDVRRFIFPEAHLL